MFLFHFCNFFYLDTSLKFEVWRKKTHLILFQVGFFFIIINFIFSQFLLFIWFLFFFFNFSLSKLFYCISLSLFHLFPFLFYSYQVFLYIFPWDFLGIGHCAGLWETFSNKPKFSSSKQVGCKVGLIGQPLSNQPCFVQEKCLNVDPFPI